MPFKYLSEQLERNTDEWRAKGNYSQLSPAKNTKIHYSEWQWPLEQEQTYIAQFPQTSYIASKPLKLERAERQMEAL